MREGGKRAVRSAKGYSRDLCKVAKNGSQDQAQHFADIFVTTILLY